MRLDFLIFATGISSVLMFLSGCSNEGVTGPPNGLPRAPSVPFPAHGSLGHPTTLTLTWQASTDPENDPVTYDVSFGTPQDPPLVAVNRMGTAYDPVTLARNTTYFWMVTAKDDRGNSMAGPVWNFATEGSGGGPPPPTLSWPADGAVLVSLPPTLTWNASTSATTYRLQISGDSLFTDPVGPDGWFPYTRYEATELRPATTYLWRVKALNSQFESEWSSVWSFTTGSWDGGGAPCPGTPTITYEGKIYNTVLIGAQCWMRENLDAGTMIQGAQDQGDNGIVEKYCFANNPANCTLYGGLYQWSEAMQYDTGQAGRGICPPGWHIPSLSEFQMLSSRVGGDGNALKVIGEGADNGIGTNTSGFSALLAGFRHIDGFFSGRGGVTYFWSSTLMSAANAGALSLYYDRSFIYLTGLSHGPHGFSVRCLRD